MSKLTKRVIESAPIKDKDFILWDTELKGFHCKITPNGKKSYFLYYRTNDGRQRRPKIGSHGVITCEQAREIALSCGINYSFINNIPGHPGEDTYCPECKKNIVDREGYFVLENNIINGKIRTITAIITITSNITST